MVVENGEDKTERPLPIELALPNRFEALDSLRGVCALIVALFHFRTSGTLTNLAFVRHGWMFVDFFFVLSGFVIAHAYARRLAARETSVLKFMALRVGRIYPIHLLILAGMIALECLLLTANFTNISQRLPFEGSRSIAAVLSNLAMLQSFGVHEQLTWNGPSWSIAAEMWTYLLFAFVFWIFARAARPTFIFIGLIAFAILLTNSDQFLNTTYELGFFRCVMGFALGSAVQWVFQKGIQPRGHFAELAIVAICIMFVSLVGISWMTFGAPLLFAITVLIFASESGIISRALKLGPFALLGSISYSFYMVHGFVQARIGDMIKLFGSAIGARLATAKRGDSEFPSDAIVASVAIADILTIGMLILTTIVAILSYRLIEQPGRKWSRKVTQDWK